MGGFGSGAERSTHIGNVEDTVAIDIRILRRLGVIAPGECVIDTICWSNGGCDAPSARLRSDLSGGERGGTMQIDFTSSGTTIKQHVAIDAVPSGFGGWRYYLICPIVGQRCEIIYLSNGVFACRESQRLSYASQNMDQLSRARRQATKLRRRLDGKTHFGRPRGNKRVKLVDQLKTVNHAASELYYDRLRIALERSGTR
jgi:hypothetical protein